MSEVRYLVSGDCSVCVEFGNAISPEINTRIRAFKIAVEQSAIDGIVETVPPYRSLLVHYKPEIIGFKALTEKFESLMSSLSSIQIPPPTVIEIPVLYGGEMGTGGGRYFVTEHHLAYLDLGRLLLSPTPATDRDINDILKK